MDLLIENGYVVERGRRLDVGPDVQRIDARRQIVIPGLVSAHSRVTLDPLPGFRVPSDAGQDRHTREVARAAAHGEESVICTAFSEYLWRSKARVQPICGPTPRRRSISSEFDIRVPTLTISSCQNIVSHGESSSSGLPVVADM